jgi:hypothetical protein
MSHKKMTRDQLLYSVHQALQWLDWLDRHVVARSPERTASLIDTITDMRGWMVRLLREFEPPVR